MLRRAESRGVLSLLVVDVIDISFDFRSDTPGYGMPGVDPDASSPTLRRYHQLTFTVTIE